LKKSSNFVKTGERLKKNRRKTDQLTFKMVEVSKMKMIYESVNELDENLGAFDN
jgi:hypothetical protein